MTKSSNLRVRKKTLGCANFSRGALVYQNRSPNTRFSDEKVEFLLNLQWRNWDEEKIFNNLEMLTSETDNFWNEENLNERKQI